MMKELLNLSNKYMYIEDSLWNVTSGYNRRSGAQMIEYKWTSILEMLI